MRAGKGWRLQNVEHLRKIWLAGILWTGASLFPARSPAQVTLASRTPDPVCRELLRRPPPKYDSVSARRIMDCARTDDSLRRAQILDAIHVTIVRMADLPWFIPEYHDEQPLSDGGTGLGPTAYMFASPYLSGFTSQEQFQAHGAMGVLSALVHVEAPPSTTLPTTYKNLHLQPGMNCVYIAYVPGATAPGPWYSRVVHPAPGKACDRNAYNAGTDGGNLPVLRTSIVGMDHKDFPPVARFGEGSLGEPLLGIKCLDAWCEVAPSSAVAYRPPGTTVPGREGKIKGWHDEQILTEQVGGVLKPSSVRAALIPVHGLDNLTEADFQSDWQDVATIEIKAANPPLGSKYYRWGLRKGKNRLQVRSVPGKWVARLFPADGSPAVDWNIIDREPHFDAAVPGTARWRMSILDDGAWVPCGTACCQAEGPLT